MEKQQLAALGEALPRLLEQLNTPDQHADEDAESIASFPDDPTIEFKVGRMALGYAAQEDRLVLVAHDVEAGEDESIPPTLSCRFTREQARSLSESCAEAVAGGRPICQLCHRPIDPEGHMCPRANGHQKLTRREGGRPEPVQSLTERAGPLCRTRNMLPSKALSGVGWMCMQPVELAASCAQTRRAITAAVWTSS